MPDSFSRYELYTTVGSIYCYPGTNILRNKYNIRDHELLKTIESDFYSVRQAELLCKPISGKLTPNHLCRIHRFFFSEIYSFAGHYRREDILKGKTRFLSYQQIPEKLSTCLSLLHEEKLLQSLSNEEYLSRAAYYFAELNYIHPFREGNGRTTREFMRMLFLQAGYSVDWSKIDRTALLDAMELSVYESAALIPILRQCLFRLP